MYVARQECCPGERGYGGKYYSRFMYVVPLSTVETRLKPPNDCTRTQLPANREEIVRRMNRAIRLALLRRGGVPNHFTSHVVRNGVLTLTVDGEFEVRDTFGEPV